jgi:hypothetical protein
MYYAVHTGRLRVYTYISVTPPSGGKKYKRFNSLAEAEYYVRKITGLYKQIEELCVINDV